MSRQPDARRNVPEARDSLTEASMRRFLSMSATASIAGLLSCSQQLTCHLPGFTGILEPAGSLDAQLAASCSRPMSSTA